MTLDELKGILTKVNDEYEKTRVKPDGTYNADAAGKYWDSLPRIPYSELPPELQAVADEITIEAAKKFLHECYLDGDFSKYEADPELYDKAIIEALHAAKYEVSGVNTELRITGNAAIDAVERENRPVSLYANDFMTAWETVTKEKRPRNVAIERGALMTIGGHISSYSIDDLKDALNGFSIFELPGDTTAEKAFLQNGQLNTMLVPVNKLTGVTKLHEAFLMFGVEAVKAAADDSDYTISFYTPTICRELHIDPRQYSTKRGDDATDLSELRFNALIDLVRPFEKYVGRTPDGSYYRVYMFDSYEKDGEIFKIRAPYLFKLKEHATAQQLKHSPYNSLFHSSVVSEPNHAAVELANRILTGLVTRGTRADYRTYKTEPKKARQTVTKTDDKGNKTTTTTVYDTTPDEQPAQQEPTVTWKCKFSTLIADSPQAAAELAAILADNTLKNKSQVYNSKLRHLFETAYRIIEEKSDAPTYYVDLTLPTTVKTVGGKKKRVYDIPTKSTVNRFCVIKHRGKRKTT